MGRTAARFEDVYRDFVESLGKSYDDLADAEKPGLLRHFNAGYRAAWQFKGVAWEDSWEDGVLTVTAGLIDYGALDDAHVYNLWTKDPRVDSLAVWVESTTAAEGVWVGTGVGASVYGFWRPVCAKFDGVDLEAPVIAILTDAVIGYAQAEYWRAAGQYETASARRRDAINLCDDLAAVEFPRLQRKWWLQRRE